MIIIFSTLLLSFKGLVLPLYPTKCSEFSHKVSGDIALGNVTLGFDGHIFPLILEFGLFTIEAQG